MTKLGQLILAKAAALKPEVNLQPQQERVVEKLKTEPGVLAFHGLGSGKTLASIAAGESIPGPKQVVVPASLRENYKKELAKFVKGTPKDYSVESYDAATARPEMPEAALTIFDEAQRMGREGTALSSLGPKAKGKVLLLSGTPVRNEPSELLPLLRAIAKDRRLPTSAKAFDQQFITREPKPLSIWGQLTGQQPDTSPRLKNIERLRQLLKGRIDYQPSVGEFPTTSEKNIDVTMTPEQTSIYRTMAASNPGLAYKIKYGLPPSREDSQNLNSFMAAVRQVSNAPTSYATKLEGGAFAQSPKLRRMFEEIKQRASDPNFRGVAYSNYIDSGIQPLVDQLNKANIPTGMFTGKLNDQQRRELVDRYNRGHLKMLALSGAGAEGLDLKGTRLMQIMEPHWNKARIDQVIGRAVRHQSHSHLPEQDRNVEIQRYFAKPRPTFFQRIGFAKPETGADRYLQSMTERKQKLVDQLLDVMKSVGQEHSATQKAAAQSDFAPGLPDRRRFGDVSQIPRDRLLQYVVQLHKAQRAGKHYDVRMGGGPPGHELFSWATKKELPKPGQKIMLYQQPLHRGSYADFEGTLVHGYGKGTVKTHDKGQVIVSRAEPDHITFTVAHKKYPERYTLIRYSGPPGSPMTDRMAKTQGGSWLMINTTPMDAAKMLGGKPNEVGLMKPKYAKVDAKDVDKLFDTKYLHQEKIDGASALYHLLGDKIEAVSYRTGVGGRPVLHTYRVFGPTGGKHGIRIPKELHGTILRGEISGRRAGATIPPQELGGILNASIANSLEKQRTQKVKMHNTLFDIVREGKKPIAPGQLGADERLAKLKAIMPYLPKGQFSLPQSEDQPANQKAMFHDIVSGLNPLTHEGIVAWPKAPGGPIKVKATPESDVHIKSIFPGEGRLAGHSAGGFEYSNEPKGSIMGRVGTGFDDATRRDMVDNPDQWLNRVARIRSQGKFPSGAHRAPAFIARHEDISPVNEVQDV